MYFPKKREIYRTFSSEISAIPAILIIGQLLLYTYRPVVTFWNVGQLCVFRSVVTF